MHKSVLYWDKQIIVCSLKRILGRGCLFQSVVAVHVHHTSSPSSPARRSLPSTTTMAAPAEEIRANSYVGFDTITQQIEHKLLKRGFQFNVIVVGAFLPHFRIPERDTEYFCALSLWLVL